MHMYMCQSVFEVQRLQGSGCGVRAYRVGVHQKPSEMQRLLPGASTLALNAADSPPLSSTLQHVGHINKQQGFRSSVSHKLLFLVL